MSLVILVLSLSLDSHLSPVNYSAVVALFINPPGIHSAPVPSAICQLVAVSSPIVSLSCWFFVLAFCWCLWLVLDFHFYGTFGLICRRFWFIVKFAPGQSAFGSTSISSIIDYNSYIFFIVNEAHFLFTTYVFLNFCTCYSPSRYKNYWCYLYKVVNCLLLMRIYLALGALLNFLFHV